ncbi:MAG: TrmB family transcriptional regulator sugar-binding domain-containing protein [Candidatus Undinarchaeales archaeon]
MKKKNIYNYLIVISAIILIVFISVKFFGMEENELQFTGPNIYRAVYVYEAVNNRGYAVNLSFDGKWTDSGEGVSGSGRIYSSGMGYFTVNYNGRIVSLGGPLTAKEDISMKSFSIIPLHEEVVKIGLEPAEYSDLNEMYNEINLIAKTSAGSGNLYNSGVKGTVMLDTNTTLYPTLIQKINNEAGSELNVKLFDRGLYLYLNNTNAKDIQTVSSVLADENIGVKGTASGRLLLFARAKQRVSADRDEIIDTLKDLNLDPYTVKIIREPIQ